MLLLTTQPEELAAAVIHEQCGQRGRGRLRSINHD
jgi:hypothetical protein